MPVFQPATLRDIATRIFAAAGAPEPIARRVAASLVLSNLAGMDSHGVLRIPQYLESVEQGFIVPAAQPEIVRERGVAAVMDGRWAFGQIVAERAMQLAIEKAEQHIVGIVSFSKVLHIGRLGEWVSQAAERGLIGMAMTNGARPGGTVAPHGSRQRLLGTNPVAFGLPAGTRPPIVADFSTSVTAEGKVRLAKQKNERVPEGWLLDRTGRPTTNPADLYDDGALCPLGGHKGYGLSLTVEVLGGILSGANVPVSADYVAQNGVLMMAIDPSFFRPTAEYDEVIETLLDAVKASPPAEGIDSVLIPGEPELLCHREREKNGIPVNDQTWATIRQAADRLGVSIET